MNLKKIRINVKTTSKIQTVHVFFGFHGNTFFQKVRLSFLKK